MEVTSPSFAREALACVHDGIAVFRHPWRMCIYDEAEVLLNSGEYRRFPIREQVAQYRAGWTP